MSSDIPSVIEDDAYHGVFHAKGGQNAFGGKPGAAGDAERPYRFHLAEMLKQTRLAKGWTLEQVAEMTRVRRVYLEALEQAAYDVLPSRAFAIGHVKAYAKALGLDEETLADMFKTEVAETNTRLHAPSGASLEDVKPNYRLYVSAAMCLVAAIAVWNVVQHNPNLLSSKARGTANLDSQPWSLGVPMIRDGVIYVTRSAPPPKDQDVPAPYVTPGLEQGFASIMATSNHDALAPVPVQDVETRKAFNPRGAVYGATPETSAVTLQATKSVNLIVRGGDNTVYFAHELGEGEAYRLPSANQQELAVEVSDPAALEIYYNGEYAGALDGPQTTVGRLNQRAAQLSAVLDARQAQSGVAANTYRNPAPAPEKPQLAQHSDAPIPYAPAAHALAPAPVRLTPRAEHAAAAAAASKSAEAPRVEAPKPETAKPETSASAVAEPAPAAPSSPQ
ncbi:MAG: helix-turn-helix domain-containing protein [Asticcacaulis sp.]